MSGEVVIVGVAALAGILLMGGAGKGDGGGFGGGAGGGAGGDGEDSKFSDVADIIFNLPSYVVPDEPFNAISKKIPGEGTLFSGLTDMGFKSGSPDYFSDIFGQTPHAQTDSKKQTQTKMFTLPFYGATGATSFGSYLSTHNIFGKKIAGRETKKSVGGRGSSMHPGSYSIVTPISKAPMQIDKGGFGGSW